MLYEQFAKVIAKGMPLMDSILDRNWKQAF